MKVSTVPAEGGHPLTRSKEKEGEHLDSKNATATRVNNLAHPSTRSRRRKREQPSHDEYTLLAILQRGVEEGRESNLNTGTPCWLTLHAE
ncbi:hypothetical protein J6590_056845 [Homalodisca vitripennis]|nr:hypothetical protein J6590_056845 [Homalodisca vitripennis]